MNIIRTILILSPKFIHEKITPVESYQTKISLSWYQKYTFLYYDTPETAFNCVSLVLDSTRLIFLSSVVCVCVKKWVYLISLQLTWIHVEKDSVTTKKKVLLSKVSLCCKIFYKTWKHAFEKRYTYREREVFQSKSLLLPPFFLQESTWASFTLIFTLGTDIFCIFRFNCKAINIKLYRRFTFILYVCQSLHLLLHSPPHSMSHMSSL